MSEAPSKLTEALMVAHHWARRRAEECRCFCEGTCVLVNGILGWRHGIDQPSCDACWELGGEKSETAQAFREGYARTVVGNCTSRVTSGRPMSREVIVQLTVRHKTISEDRFRAPDIQAAMSGPVEWPRVKSSWEKALSFAKSVISGVVLPLDPEQYKRRHASCHGIWPDGTKVGAPCHLRRQVGDRYFCGACGCGSKPLAELDHKLKYPYLECPLGRPGFSNHV